MNLWCPACGDTHRLTAQEVELIVYALLDFSTSGDMTEDPQCLYEVRTWAMDHDMALKWRALRKADTGLRID